MLFTLLLFLQAFIIIFLEVLLAKYIKGNLYIIVIIQSIIFLFFIILLTNLYPNL